MAHFAKINSSNIVIGLHVLNNKWLLDENNNESETKGIERLTQIHGDISPNYWKQYSIHTKGNVHSQGKDPFRKNAANLNGHYDSERDAFYDTQPFASWTLNATTCIWEPPVTKPSDQKDGYYYALIWDEENQKWTGQRSDNGTIYSWNPETSTWVA